MAEENLEAVAEEVTFAVEDATIEETPAVVEEVAVEEPKPTSKKKSSVVVEEPAAVVEEVVVPSQPAVLVTPRTVNAAIAFSNRTK